MNQSYSNLEIIVSDNASEDETGDIALGFAGRDTRIRYVRQPSPVTMWQNFENTFRHMRGEFFLLAADDDVYDERFVELLLARLVAQPEAHLAFGEIRHFVAYGRHKEDWVPFPYSSATHGLPVWRRLLMERNGGYAVQGLFRMEAMSGYKWWDHSTSPDWPLMTYMLVVGEVLDVPGVFIYRPQWQKKTGEERAARQSYTSMERFPTATLSYRCAQASTAGAASVGKRRFLFVDLLLVITALLRENRRRLISLTAWRSRLQRWVRGRGTESA